MSPTAMQPIAPAAVQAELNRRAGQPLYLHLETGTGAYAALNDTKAPTITAWVRNVSVTYTRGTLTGSGPYRVGLKLDHGWAFAEGLTDWQCDDQDRLLLAGHDDSGVLLVALELSALPFSL